MQRKSGMAWLVAGLRVAAFALTLAIVLERTLNQWHPWDDDGYILIGLRGAATGHTPYTEVYSQYGPTFFLVGLVFRITRLPITFDVARILTACMTVAGAAALGYVTTRLTRSAAAGVLSSVLTALTSAAQHEAALHPTHLVALFAALAVLGVVRLDERGPSSARAALVAVPTVLAVLSKVNAGGLLAAAVAIGLAPSDSRWVRVARRVFPLVLVSVLVVSAEKSGSSTSLLRVLGVAAVIGAFAVRLKTQARRDTVALVLWWCLGTVVVMVVLMLGLGTSPAALFRGVVLDPLLLARAFTVQLIQNERTWGAVALMGALAAARGPRHFVTCALGAAGGISVFAGVWMAAPSPLGVEWLAVGAAAAWCVTVEQDERFATSRATLYGLGVLLPLMAFPVAGGQRFAGALAFPTIGVVALSDAWRRLNLKFTVRWLTRGLILEVACAIAAVALLDSAGRAAERDWRRALPLALPGAQLVRTDLGTGDALRVTTAALRRCRAFYSLPGLNSFYLFTRERPPTWSNSTTWMALFDRGRQERVLRDVKPRIDCVVRNSAMEHFWIDRGHEQPGPLRAYFDSFRHEVVSIGGYTVYRLPRGNRTHRRARSTVSRDMPANRAQ